MTRLWMVPPLVVLVTQVVSGAELTGRVVMPEVCSPGVSPAVVTLQAEGQTAPAASAGKVSILVGQKNLQFVPRIQAIAVGQSVRFTNEDAETHNVHVVARGETFNQSMAPGRPVEFRPRRTGVIQLLCDIHSHMRGYVVVSPSPWFAVCAPDGAFRITGVPAGRYQLTVWHELGTTLRREIEVPGTGRLTLEPLRLEVPEGTVVRSTAPGAPARRWAEVIDRIGLMLADASRTAKSAAGLASARALAESAYWEEFEGSGMETAVRAYLGYKRAGQLERHFFAILRELGTASKAGGRPARLGKSTGVLLLDLHRTAEELNRKGVVDRDHLAAGGAGPAPAVAAEAEDAGHPLLELRQAFDRVQELADQGRADDAAAELTIAYFESFEPIEQTLWSRAPGQVDRLEARYRTLRGYVGQGTSGERLATELDGFLTLTRTALGGREAAWSAAGLFGSSFASSLIIILREGIEVILLLTMLVTLVAKTGQGVGLRALWAGVAAAVVASLLTAFGLNRLMTSAQGRTREELEGIVLMAAAGILFYVSYWLIAQSQVKRWTDFLKGHARRGATFGSSATLALTAFLAVYREGAETALMYQALVVRTPRPGVVGIVVGLVLGLVVLAVVAALIRAASVRLPLRLFFRLTSLTLFLMAVVFAGKGVAELQSAGFVKVTPLAGLGDGFGPLGVYPNLQVLSVQGLLLAGAALAFVVLAGGEAATPRPGPSEPTASQPTRVQMGV